MSRVDLNQRLTGRLRFWLPGVILALMALILAGSVRAHTLEDARARLYVDIPQSGFSVQLDINAEALLAGFDPSVTNSNDSPKAAEYDRLRALPPDALRAVFDVELRARLLDAVTISFDGTPVDFEVIDETFFEVGDTTKPRRTRLELLGNVPEGAKTVSFRWTPEMGAIIFRTIGARTRIVHIERLEGGAESQSVEIEQIKTRSLNEMLKDFVVIGFEHIVPLGLDHILFVVGIFLLSTRLRPILMQVTTFTVAHTVTLGLGAMGFVNIDPGIVEPLIAASIVYVAVENIATGRLSPWRPAVVFAFGLLHGLGFAGVLAEFNLPAGDFIWGLLAFNIGVELGQLAVIAACFAAVGIWFGNRNWYRAAVVIPGSAMIGLVGAWWVVERTVL